MTWLHAMIDAPEPHHAAQAAFWADALGWPAGDPWPAHPELRSFEPPSGAAYVHLQEIEGPPRVHIDVECHDLDAAVWLAEELGATVVDGNERWRTLASPGGLPFCVLGVRDHEAPGPVAWPDGHHSRVVQVCIDSPGAVHEREVEFWRALLPDRWVDFPAREFAGKSHDDAGSPIQLLFQRLDEPDGRVRAHLDLGTDDLAAEVGRLSDLGAGEIGPGRGWHALRDPAGLPFCATTNSPMQTKSRDIG